MLDGVKELKPCPFCGGDAVLNCIGDTENGVEWWVEHFRCGSNVGIETDFLKSPDEAIAAWNTRVTTKNSEDTPNFAYGNDAVYWHDEYEKLAKAVEVIRNATERTCVNTDKDNDDYFTCSVCGSSSITEFLRGGYGIPNYCPNCGAKVVK